MKLFTKVATKVATTVSDALAQTSFVPRYPSQARKRLSAAAASWSQRGKPAERGFVDTGADWLWETDVLHRISALSSVVPQDAPIREQDLLN
ncbi:MAG: hypothetical protein KDJ99_16365, partial [Candidatus Competibacteraceae bacterium]|nr:hypothetical protein [Candidatus Competibacteraceae bacterium]